ncbi:SiaB family protein kinase [Halopseudomonas pachastrellae]|nr:SiaB family protein kinase [Halopseudomonas pachastrellae]
MRCVTTWLPTTPTPARPWTCFAVYIEMTQNISHYNPFQGLERAGSRRHRGGLAQRGQPLRGFGRNLIESGDGQSLVVAIDQLAQLDKAGLKAAYKEQLRRPRDAERASGAGLGLIDIARKSSAPLQASLQPAADGRSFFSLRAVI